MSAFDLDDLDTHISNLQSQLRFFTASLASLDASASEAEADDATDAERDPEWLVTELIALKGRTGMLVDDLRRVRKRCLSKGLGSRKKEVKGPNKRLSIENGEVEQQEEGDAKANAATSSSSSSLRNGKRQRISSGRHDRHHAPPRTAPVPEPTPTTGSSGNPGPQSDGLAYPTLPTLASNNNTSLNSASSSDTVQATANARTTSSNTDKTNTAPVTEVVTEAEGSTYQPHYINITEEVHRRLYAARLRQLSSRPRTSQKRKYDTFTTLGHDSSPSSPSQHRDSGEKDADGNQGDEGRTSPAKRLKMLTGRGNASTGGAGTSGMDWTAAPAGGPASPSGSFAAARAKVLTDRKRNASASASADADDGKAMGFRSSKRRRM